MSFEPISAVNSSVENISKNNDSVVSVGAHHAIDSVRFGPFIEAVVASAPPLDATQRERIARMLLGGGSLK